MTSNEIGLENLHAAKALRVRHPRSCVSRAYYAAHWALTGALIEAGGFSPTVLRQTPKHNDQSGLVGRYLGRGSSDVRELRKLFRRLYARRIDADYKRTVSVGQQTAIGALRDASSVFRMLGVNEL